MDDDIIPAKVVLLGESGVGKSSIALRFNKGEFSSSHDVTIGGSYLQHLLTLDDGSKIRMHIWDTAGSEKFRAMAQMYYRDTDAAIITYDLSDEKSFKEVQYWIDELKSKSDQENLTIALVGNKCDLEPAKRRVTFQQSKELAQAHDMLQHETSAKTGEGIQELFKQLAQVIVQKKKQ